MQRVLFAVDDSVESLAAVRYGARLAADWNAAVRIMTAVAESPAETNAARKAEAERLVKHVVRTVAAAGVPAQKADSVVRAGEAFRCILEEARSWQADLIVMAVSHRSGLRSPYVGSQTEHVLEFTPCPVLVVPGASSVS